MRFPGLQTSVAVLASALTSVSVASSQPAPATPPPTTPAPTQHDGQHDFDFEAGTWRTHIARLIHPLTGSNTWAQYDGTSVVHKLWNGHANLLELQVEGPAGHIEALSLRLYDPGAHQWSLNFSNSRIGTLGVPTVGSFHDGRGEFYDQEMIGDRMVWVRFLITDITPDSCHFEQAFSVDGGRSWEVNWVATDTRIPDAPDATN